MWKKIVFAFILVTNICYAQTVAFKGNGADQTSGLQQAFNDKETFTVAIQGKVMVNGTVNIPQGKVLQFDAGCMLTGNGTINGGIIDAGYQHQVFDISLNINPEAVNQYFSVKWFGAKGKGTDDHQAIQKSINTCIKNNIRTVFIPVGRYNISKPLIVRGETYIEKNLESRSFCTLEILGESSFWDSNIGSEIIPAFNNSFAIGIQTGKGCKVRKLTIKGRFNPPHLNNQMKFFNTSFENFTDGSSRDSRYSPYAGIVIDPFTNHEGHLPPDGGYPGLKDYYGKANNLGDQSGSTGIELEELSIRGFVVGICSAPNAITRNAEITLINKVQFTNCKLAISGGQDQEKANQVTNVYCWGGTHTMFATGLYGTERQAGHWIIDRANIAGGVVRFIYNEQHGYFPTNISNVFAESLGSWGTINSEIACEVYNCMIDFAYQREAGEQTLLTSWGKNIVYRNCNFRYYGEDTPLKMQGNCVFENCYFSGPVKRSGDSDFSIKAGIFKIPGNWKLWVGLSIVFLILSSGFYALGRRNSYK